MTYLALKSRGTPPRLESVYRSQSFRRSLKRKNSQPIVLWMCVVVLTGWGLWGDGLNASPTLVFGASSFGKAQEVSLGSTPLTNELLIGIAKKTTPSVVNVSVTTKEKMEKSTTPFPFFDDPFFRRFFGDEFDRRFAPPKEFRKEGTGSGVIVSEDGFIITNNHVVEQAEDIVVLLSDERELSARLIGTDPKTDLAVIKIEASNLPYLEWGDSTKLQIGEVVLAVGNPFGLNQTVTMGIVSAVGRANVGIVDYEDFIQTDAAINPGNSGGALVNLKGELIGINTAIFSRSGGYMGIGFAIPSRIAKTTHRAIIEHGKVIRGWLGVSIQKVTSELAEQFKVPDKQGALVSTVIPNSPAKLAGLERGDIIREYDGRQVTNPQHLRNLVAETQPGKTISLTIIREGKDRTIRLTVQEQPRESFVEAQVGEAEGAHALTGVIVEPMPRGEIPEGEGVRVREIFPGSPADRSGLHIEDVILEINRQTIRDIQAFNQVVQQLSRNQSVLLLVRREKGIFYIPIKP